MKFSKLSKKGVGGTEFFVSLMIGVFIVIMIAFALALASSTLKNTDVVKNDNTSLALINNYTSGLTSVATYVPTWLILGGLVVVIGIIVVLILVIMRVKGVASSGEGYAM
jgi:hypothetical protein